MNVLEVIISLVAFPIHWFWERVEIYKERQQIAKIVLLFVVSLSGVVLICVAILWLILYLFNNYPEWVVIIGLIAWLYAFVKSKMKFSTTTPSAETPTDVNQQKLQSQAEKDYPRMRTVMSLSLKEVAAQIGCIVPRLLSEIEIAGIRYIISKGIIFYQWKLKKADIKARYTIAELDEFKEILQATIVSLSDSGRFPTLQLQSYQTIYGNWLCGVTVDVIEDLDSHLIIQTVFASPAYAEYQHDIQMNKQNNDNATLPDAVWDEYDC